MISCSKKIILLNESLLLPHSMSKSFYLVSVFLKLLDHQRQSVSFVRVGSLTSSVDVIGPFDNDKIRSNGIATESNTTLAMLSPPAIVLRPEKDNIMISYVMPQNQQFLGTSQ